MLVMMARGHKAISLSGSWGWRPRLTIARQLLTLGVPAAMEQVLSSGAFMVLVGVVALIGTHALAAQQITFTALSLAFLPAFGFSIAATALVGQSIGARVPADARKATRIALRWALIWMGIGGVLAFLFSERMMNVFSADPAVIAAGTAALRSLSVALPFWGLWFVSSGSLRGSGDTRTPVAHRRLDDVALGADRLDRGAMVRGRAGNGLVRVRADYGAGVGADVVGLSPAHR